MKQCIQCLVRGRVQGVFFRASAREEARRLNLAGWARNLPDGSVAVLACGEADAVAQMRQWLRHGPALARVDSLDCLPADPNLCPDDFEAG